MSTNRRSILPPGLEPTRRQLRDAIASILRGVEQIDTASLPTAAETYRGKLYLVTGTGATADTLQICLKTGSATYAWTTIV
jgi:hypothetical protein